MDNMSQLYTCRELSAARKAQPAVPSVDRPLVVDFHCHMVVPAAEVLAKPHIPPLPEPAHRYSSSETRQVNLAMLGRIRQQLTSVERRLTDMDEAGIDIQVLSPSPGQYCYWAEEELGAGIARTVNDALCETVAANSRRMVALGTLPMQSPRLAVQELRRCVKELGMRGVEISTNVEGVELSDPRFEPILATAEELGAIVFLHPAGFTQGQRLTDFHLNNVIGNPLETTVALSHLIYGGSLDRMPGLKLVLAHGGGTLGAYTGRFDHAHHSRMDCAHCKHPPSHYLRRMYMDSVVFDPVELKHLVGKFGADRILAGTDYPYDMAEPDLLGFIERAGLPVEDAAAILGGNAAQLLGLDPEATRHAARRQTP
jgi:aminocarboxymuconate-semialdehyde decarboxylase